MSMEMIAFVRSQQLPNRQQWQDSIDALEIPLTLDPEPELATHSGFWPCTLEDELAGFELSVEKANDLPYELERLNTADRTIAITFRWSSSAAEGACILAAAPALSVSCDAVVYYADDDQILSAAELRDELGQMLQDLD